MTVVCLVNINLQGYAPCFVVVCRDVLIKGWDFTEVCCRTTKHLRVSNRLYHALLSNTSSIYIQVKQEDIETESDGDSESEKYRDWHKHRACYGTMIIIRISAGGYKLSLSLSSPSVDF